METQATHTAQTVGIIGGGKVGLHLLELFAGSPLAQVVYVVDRNPQAPALERARQDRLAVLTDIQEALNRYPVDVIFEVTASAQVVKLLKQLLNDTATELVTHDMAYLILQVLEQRHTANKTLVSTEIAGIRSEIQQSLTGIHKLVDDIKDISDEMIMLALNARIEAARAGEFGRGFAVVAQKMAESISSVQAITPEIEKISAKILSISNKIEASLQNLR